MFVCFKGVSLWVEVMSVACGLCGGRFIARRRRIIVNGASSNCTVPRKIGDSPMVRAAGAEYAPAIFFLSPRELSPCVPLPMSLLKPDGRVLLRSDLFDSIKIYSVF